MRSSPSLLSRLLADYGMVLVLALLCVFFSIATQSEQHPTGAEAGHALSSDLLGRYPKGARILVAVPDQPESIAFAEALATDLTRGGAQVRRVTGDPKAARTALQEATKDGPLDAIACDHTSASWMVFSDVPTDFPALGRPRIEQPAAYRWPNFLKRDNLLNIANQIAVIAIVAIGMTLVIITGGIDLSVGSLIALAAVLATLGIRDVARAQQASPWGMTASCLVAILATGLAGGVTGSLITVFRLPPFIVTLAMMLVASGGAYLLTHGQSVYQVPDTFVWLGRGTGPFGLPIAVLLMVLLYSVAHFVMSGTVLGRHLYAVGGNRVASRYSGVPVRRVILTAYVVSGLLSGLGGVVLASQLKSGSPTFGNMYELYVIAAVVVGGASLNGGTGRMFGTLVGAFVIAVIQNGMNLMNVESYTQKVVLGLVILGAVLLDLLRERGWRLDLSGGD